MESVESYLFLIIGIFLLLVFFWFLFVGSIYKKKLQNFFYEKLLLATKTIDENIIIVAWLYVMFTSN